MGSSLMGRGGPNNLIHAAAAAAVLGTGTPANLATAGAQGALTTAAPFDHAHAAGPRDPGPYITTPPSTGWSWVNQGGATITTETGGGLTLVAPAGAGENLRIYARTMTSTFIAHVQQFAPKTDSNGTGIGVRDSATGKIVLFSISGSTLALGVYKYTNATTYSATYASALWPTTAIWMKVADTGGNLVFSSSSDPKATAGSFITITSQARTNWLANPDQWIIHVGSSNATYPGIGRFESVAAT